MFDKNAVRWTQLSATLGAATWALLAILAAARKAPLGPIELLFLFAPLVIVPLGIELARVMAPGEAPAIEAIARTIQPFAAGLSVASFWLPPSAAAGALAIPWVVLCGLIALRGLLGLMWAGHRSLTTVAVKGRMDLAVAAGWLLISRLGIHPLNFQEPIVLLTAIHFHYTGFATTLLAALTLDFARRQGHTARLLGWLVAAVVFVPFVVAAGFVFSPLLKLAGVLVLSVGLAGVALFTWWFSRELSSGTARIFIRVSSVAVLAGMALATVYGIGDMLRKDWLLIPHMAGTHGLLNGIGFVLCGLLGWLVEKSSRERTATPLTERGPRKHEDLNVLTSEKLTS